MRETSSSKTISTKLKRIAKLAKEMPRAALTTLAHHIDIAWLKEAYRRTRKDAAPGNGGLQKPNGLNCPQGARVASRRATADAMVKTRGRCFLSPEVSDGSLCRDT